MNRTTFNRLDADRPPLPLETCPLIDRTSTLVDATAADLARIRDELRAAGDLEHADELGEVAGCLAIEMRERLELLRAANHELRTSARYWRDGARELHKMNVELEAELDRRPSSIKTAADVEAWAAQADAFELGQVALAIKARIRAIGGKIDELELAGDTDSRAKNDN